MPASSSAPSDISPEKTIDIDAIGALLRTERRKRFLTQAELARLSGVSKSRIEAIECGRCRDVGFGLISDLLYSLGLAFRVVETQPPREMVRGGFSRKA